MSLEDFYKAWDWSCSPNLGDIYKREADLIRLFGFRDALVSDTVFLLQNPMSTRGVLLSGLPGAGKTTFLKYLEKRYFPEQMKVVSLAGRLGAVKPRGYVKVTEEQFLHIFSEIEKFLLQIININNISKGLEPTSHIREVWTGERSHLPFPEYARDILVPLCKRINKGTSKQYFLVIDDVDYIYPTDQTEILAILCDIISVTSNPIILYSARPAAAGVAKNHLITYAAHHFGEPIDVEPINAFSVIKSRLKECSGSCEHKCGPIAFSESTENIFLALSNNNIRTALDLCQAAITSAPHVLQDPLICYDEDSIIRAFFGRPALSARDEKDADNDRHIQNIFRAITPTDELPFDYITLLSFSEPRVIDDQYTLHFRQLCRLFNPVVFEKKELNDKEIISLVASAHDHSFISRIDRVKIEQLTREEVAKSDDNVWLNKFCLTPKGRFVLELSKNQNYQKMCGLESWRKLIVDKIKSQAIHVDTIDKFVPRGE